MEIRKATENDIEAISDLYKPFFRLMTEYQPNFLKEAEQDIEFIKKIIDEEISEFLVACDNGRVLGFALVTEQDTPPYNCFIQRKIAYLMDIYVDTKSQGKGIGSLLLNGVKEWVKARGLNYLELAVLNENTGAKKLYEREGFRSRIHTMGINL